MYNVTYVIKFSFQYLFPSSLRMMKFNFHNFNNFVPVLSNQQSYQNYALGI